MSPDTQSKEETPPESGVTPEQTKQEIDREVKKAKEQLKGFLSRTGQDETSERE